MHVRVSKQWKNIGSSKVGQLGLELSVRLWLSLDRSVITSYPYVGSASSLHGQEVKSLDVKSIPEEEKGGTGATIGKEEAHEKWGEERAEKIT